GALVGQELLGGLERRRAERREAGAQLGLVLRALRARADLRRAQRLAVGGEMAQRGARPAARALGVARGAQELGLGGLGRRVLRKALRLVDERRERRRRVDGLRRLGGQRLA